jgi:phthalate 4,5-dioxygenase oxygenase subunit
MNWQALAPLCPCACSARTWFCSATMKASLASYRASARTAVLTCAMAGARTTACAARFTAGTSIAPVNVSRCRANRKARPCTSAYPLASYPVIEKNGIVFAYMGEGDPPPLPDLDCFTAPDTHVFAFKGLWECNWLQAMEVGIDPVHASFLHRFLKDEDPKESYGKQFRDKAANTEIPMTQLLREYPRPEINVEETGTGLRIIALRHLDDGRTHVRVTNQVFPEAICIPMSNEMTITQWHVPVDDETCYWYSMFTSFGEPVNKQLMREQRLKEHRLPDYAPLKNKRNNYGYNPAEQADETYTGMGLDINVHDQWAVESPGPIFDRTKEHLATSDKAIIAYRRMLRKAIEAAGEGGHLPGLPNGKPLDTSGPIAVDAIAPDANWQGVWRERDAQRRADCPWTRG